MYIGLDSQDCACAHSLDSEIVLVPSASWKQGRSSKKEVGSEKETDHAIVVKKYRQNIYHEYNSMVIDIIHRILIFLKVVIDMCGNWIKSK